MLNHKDEQAIELWHSYWKMQKLIMQCIEKSASEVDLSVPQYMILVTLLHFGEVSQKNVRERTNLPKSTLSQAIDRLVERDILERKVLQTDRREMSLFLKEEGRQILQVIKDQKSGLHHTFRHIVEVFPNEKLEQFIHIQEEIIEYLQEKGGKCSC